MARLQKGSGHDPPRENRGREGEGVGLPDARLTHTCHDHPLNRLLWACWWVGRWEGKGSAIKAKPRGAMVTWRDGDSAGHSNRLAGEQGHTFAAGLMLSPQDERNM